MTKTSYGGEVKLSAFFKHEKFTKMFKLKVKRLLNEFGIKQEAIIELINSNRVSFAKKLENNSFTDIEKNTILDKYGALL